MALDTQNSKYFCNIGPDDDDIDFWSHHFNEYVCRLRDTGKILPYYADKFFATQKGFKTQVLSSLNGFKSDETEETYPLMH